MWIAFELGQVISGVGHFESCYNSGFVQFWIGLLLVFGSKSVHSISGVGSDKDFGSFDSGFESVLTSLHLVVKGFTSIEGIDYE